MQDVKLTLPPGPVGTQNARLNAKFFNRSPIDFLSQLADTYGNVSSFDLGTGPIIFVNDADLARNLFRFHEADLRKPDFLRASNTGYWGEGLTTLDDPEIWRQRRQLLLPLFRAALREPRLFLTGELTETITAHWVDREPIDLAHEVRLLIARIALRTVLDADLEGWGSAQERSGLVPYLEGYGEDFTATAGGTEGTVQMARPRAPRNMDGVLAIIRARFEEFVDRGDVLSALVRAHNMAPDVLSKQDVVGEIVQMLFAGHLTMPFALTQFWTDIADYDLDWQLVNEAARIDDAERFSNAALGMSRTMAILRESMRMTPPAPILYREVARGFRLGDHQLAEGHGIWVCPGLLHQDPRYFPQPSGFQPDRFAAGRIPPLSAKAYMPFGAGPRVCIAAAQSLSQMVVIIQTIARSFRLEPVSGTPNRFEVRRRPASRNYTNP
ncbi:cytochrome P450 [Ruegeria atlantica]|uniref:cytochrome P450 n=1 Tax=Ruegeria atlantica TaxID=81569 RepID=UPI00147DD747|nr:cytochrome P450 [Ruegeria atlantica]